MTERPSLSRNILAGVMGAGISGEALRVAARHQSYQAAALAMGASPEEAARVLGEVVTELSQTGAPGDAHAIAQHRLAEGEAFRPPKEWRDAARDLLAAHGYSTHPEDVDAQAWQLQHVMAAYAPVPGPLVPASVALAAQDPAEVYAVSEELTERIPHCRCMPTPDTSPASPPSIRTRAGALAAQLERLRNALRREEA